MDIRIVPPASISVGPRQRSELDPEAFAELKGSIASLGLLNPITVVETNPGEYELIAGFRRLTSVIELGLTEVSVNVLAEAAGIRRYLIELEENVKREDLPWADRVRAVETLHNACLEANPKWTLQQTADLCSVATNTISKILTVADYIEDGKVSSASHFTRAYATAQRVHDTKFNRIVDSLDLFSEPREEGELEEEAGPVLPSEGIHQADFLEWATAYSGPKFNVIHCDFPYGINHQDSDLGGSAHYESYQDDPDTYWRLVRGFLSHQDSFISPNANLIFWFSMNYYQETIEAFEAAGWRVVPHPLIWHKSDNRGIVSDPRRRPRHIYETALLMMRGERNVLTNIADLYSCPTMKASSFHVSEKPDSMLRHFFQLCVDEFAEFLDPTCGSGSSIRAAHSMKAKRVLGLELSEEIASSARALYNKMKTLEAAAAAVENGK